jgi:glycosyltransferase involved in cell wall biosynthesis
MKVVFFQRKKYPGVYSIESLFLQLRAAFPEKIIAIKREMKFQSKGFFRRLYISFEASLHQGDVNHVTGDIHFITLFLRKRSTVLTIHDVGFMNHPNVIARIILKWFWLILPVSHCAAITVISQSTKAEVLKYVHKKYASKIHVIYNPLRLGFSFSPKVFESSSPVILQIGTKYNKNISRLIEAISKINCRLEIVGYVSDLTLRELEFHKIRFRISMNLSDQEIIEMYKSADIVALISTNEGFGLPIIEANATGRVVISSNLSSMPEIGGNAAHYVDPYDVKSIRDGFYRVIADAFYRKKLIENGVENIKRFELTKISNEYVNLYYSLLNRS